MTLHLETAQGAGKTVCLHLDGQSFLSYWPLIKTNELWIPWTTHFISEPTLGQDVYVCVSYSRTYKKTAAVSIILEHVLQSPERESISLSNCSLGFLDASFTLPCSCSSFLCFLVIETGVYHVFQAGLRPLVFLSYPSKWWWHFYTTASGSGPVSLYWTDPRSSVSLNGQRQHLETSKCPSAVSLAAENLCSATNPKLWSWVRKQCQRHMIDWMTWSLRRSYRLDIKSHLWNLTLFSL